jgi:hypothetical protein
MKRVTAILVLFFSMAVTAQEVTGSGSYLYKCGELLFTIDYQNHQVSDGKPMNNGGFWFGSDDPESLSSEYWLPAKAWQGAEVFSTRVLTFQRNKIVGKTVLTCRRVSPSQCLSLDSRPLCS